MSLKDERTKIKVVSLAREGISYSKIAEMLEIPRQTISDFMNKNTFKSWWDKGEGILLGETPVDEDLAPKFCLIDLETSLALLYSFTLKNAYLTPTHIKEDTEIMCAAFEWLGRDKTELVTARDYWLKGDKEALEGTILSLWAILDNADGIIAHNGARFDNRRMLAKFIQYKLPPPKPYKVVDTYEMTKQFGFTSHKLGYISPLLGGQGKDSTELQLWIDCQEGVESAWDEMEEYCRGDIRELKNVYLQARPYYSKHPNMALYHADGKLRCIHCGGESMKVVENSFAYTPVSRYNLFRCESCGAYNRDRHNNIPRKNILSNITQ